MIILGIDPGLRTTGWGVIDDRQGKLHFVDCGIVTSTSSTELSDRLHQLFVAIRTIVLKHHPDECAVEETIVNKNMRTSLHLAHARAAVICAVRDVSVAPVSEYSPTQIKRFVQGGGGADKTAVLKAVTLILGNPAIAKLDASDALAAAITHALQPKVSRLLIKDAKRLSIRGGRLIAHAA